MGMSSIFLAPTSPYYSLLLAGIECIVAQAIYKKGIDFLFLVVSTNLKCIDSCLSVPTWSEITDVFNLLSTHALVACLVRQYVLYHISFHLHYLHNLFHYKVSHVPAFLTIGSLLY